MSSPLTVAVTGATGFVGRYVVRELLARGHRVRALVRSLDKAQAALPPSGPDTGLTIVQADALTPAAAAELVAGCQGCVNTIGIIREGPGVSFTAAHVSATKVITEACRAKNVGRYVHVSALGVSDAAKTDYLLTKAEGERIVKRSGLTWTILRPGLIHGNGSEFLDIARGWVSGHEAPFLFMPYFTHWEFDTRVPLGSAMPVVPRIAPVFVVDVARSVVAALEKPAATVGGEIYNIVGSETLTWPEMLRALRDTLPTGNARIEAFGVPSEIAMGVARLAKMAGFGGALPFDEGMAYMAGRDAIASIAKAIAHLGVELRPFRATLQTYASAA